MKLFISYNSALGANALFCCKRFVWSCSEFITNSVAHNNSFFRHYFNNHVSDVEHNNAMLLLESIFLRENSLFLPPNFFVYNELDDIINFVSTS